MIDTTELIESLAAEAKPTRPLLNPFARAALWLAMAGAIVILLGIEHGVRTDISVQLGKPSFTLAIGASLVTGILAAIGCLVASLPDRSRSWLLLPLPSLAVWVSTISYGCLTDWVSFQSGSMQPGEAWSCLATLLLVSLPLSAMMFVMLRHAARLRPTLVTMTAGLAVAAITSMALSLFHPLDATMMILMLNLGTAAMIVAIEGAAGRTILVYIARLTGS